jgi:hypothetical protein
MRAHTPTRDEGWASEAMDLQLKDAEERERREVRPPPFPPSRPPVRPPVGGTRVCAFLSLWASRACYFLRLGCGAAQREKRDELRKTSGAKDSEVRPCAVQSHRVASCRVAHIAPSSAAAAAAAAAAARTHARAQTQARARMGGRTAEPTEAFLRLAVRSGRAFADAVLFAAAGAQEAREAPAGPTAHRSQRHAPEVPLRLTGSTCVMLAKLRHARRSAASHAAHARTVVRQRPSRPAVGPNRDF